MHHETQIVSLKGKQRVMPAIRDGDVLLVVTGKMFKTAQVYDEVWLEPSNLPDPLTVIEKLRSFHGRPDVFTFAQRLPEVTPKHQYCLEWDNFAVTRTASYEQWFEQMISKEVRKKIKKAARQGVTTEEVHFDDKLVRGIKSIYDESPYRQGRPFWHYQKDVDTIKAENSTYSDRSIFIGAFYSGMLIGFVKLILLGNVASTMQVISKIEHFDKAPNNALLAKTVSVCSSLGVEFLTYGAYSYGRKGEFSSITDFKRANGFFRMDVPRYYVPLTFKGKAVLRSGIRNIAKMRIHSGLIRQLIDFRSKMYKILYRK